MNKLLIYLIPSLVLFSIGCSPKLKKEVELTEDNFAELHASKVRQVCIISHGKPGTIPYTYDFLIGDPEKIKKIVECIRNAKMIADNNRQTLWRDLPKQTQDINQYNLRQTRRLIIFETRKILYSTRIVWDAEMVYGKWWKSPELLEHFEQWNLLEDISKADPNWPPPEWLKNPPPEREPYDPNAVNLDPNYIPFP